MADTDFLALVHAEIDGELDAQQRAALARRLLADPEAREVREDLLRLQAMLEGVGEVEPPPELRAQVLRALPLPVRPHRRVRWPALPYRYAALIAGVLATAAVVYETVDGTGAGSADLAGTIAARRAPLTLDTVALSAGPVTGRVSLYRDGSGLGLAFELASGAPVDVLVTSDGQTLRVEGLGTGTSADQRTTIALPETGAAGRRVVDLTFLTAGREVARATLTAPGSR
jgi:anti-sigma factor RsiW